MNQDDVRDQVKAAGVDPDLWPTVVKLVIALSELQDSKLQPIIKRACSGVYHDFLSQSATPLTMLVHVMRQAGYPEFVNRVIDGEFDATHEEGEQWVKHTPEGRAVFAGLLSGGPDQ